MKIWKGKSIPLPIHHQTNLIWIYSGLNPGILHGEPLFNRPKSDVSALVNLLSLSELCGSSVGIATRCRLDGFGFIPGRLKRFLFVAQRPDRLWDPHSLLFSGYRILFPQEGKAARTWSWPLTSILYRGQEWRSYVSIPPPVFMAWCLIN
jgi:hypothetical protein